MNKQQGRPDEEIDFHWNTNFPIRTPAVLRAVLAEPKLVDALLRACWETNRDVGPDSALLSVIAEAGYDAGSIMTKADRPDIKEYLRFRTKEATDTGICGAPSDRTWRRKTRSGDQGWTLFSDIIWGQDEISVVEDSISGWNGERNVSEPGLNEVSRSGPGL